MNSCPISSPFNSFPILFPPRMKYFLYFPSNLSVKSLFVDLSTPCRPTPWTFIPLPPTLTTPTPPLFSTTFSITCGVFEILEHCSPLNTPRYFIKKLVWFYPLSFISPPPPSYVNPFLLCWCALRFTPHNKGSLHLHPIFLPLCSFSWKYPIMFFFALTQV